MLSDASGHVKAERLSPDPPAATDSPNNNNNSNNNNSSNNNSNNNNNTHTIRHTSPTPSTSPKSPASHRTRTPSFAGTPPNPTFTPPTTALHSPYDRFSPAALGAMGGLPGTHGPMKQMETIMTKNCSELMRSLAAKYNYRHPNDYFSNPNNGFLRAPLSNIPPFKGGPSPFIGVSAPSVTSAPSSLEVEKKIDTPVSTVTAGLSAGIPASASPHLFPGPGIPGFPGFPIVDMSSTQVLLSMVRNATASQQSQLENYLRGALKRPADAPPPTSPLDLSSSVGTKRPRTDLPRSFDVKSLFPVTSDEDSKREDKIHVSPDTSLSIAKSRSLSSPSTPGKYSSVAIPCTDRDCPSMEAILHWTVEDVCSFVGSIDLCSEYVEAFRDQRIDGSALPLLTEEHLTSSINMKLGPALKLRSVLARKLGTCGICLHCAHCHASPTERRPNSASSGQ
ncbi:Sterile alpha motif domain-containing protein 11 [Armadillidium vulgare]|nr:Sterile alpha motif domain-containing protein 11 [Armadillidium vulgare]